MEVPRNRTAVLFGLISAVFGTDFVSLFQNGMPLEIYHDSVLRWFQGNPGFALALVPISILSILSGCGLVVSLADKRLGLVATTMKASGAVRRIFLLEAGFLLTGLILGILLTYPYFLSGRESPVSVILLIFGAAIYIFTLTQLFYSKTYSSFHIILSNVSLRTGIDLGYGLFRKRISSSLIFGMVSILVNLTLSSVLASVIDPILTLFPFSVMKISAISFLIVAAFSYLNAVNKSAWLKLFKYIASQPKPSIDIETSQEDEKMIQREIPGTGQA
ncbi:MAG: hypothetical protein HGA31_01245 [Candidatus Moranbacteria bacterium]|nr:hypothetical protein [Candidatus Moranbacteria bacterium]